ncbi:hypothetical protein RHSIM_Rhsim07G0052700 [Rhododendron simsii]|nr:hypothetical protein RHSIM_Rhsim07G0052700 [Rhododendron simsii]
MGFFSAIVSCFLPSRPPGTSDDSRSKKEKADPSSGKGERKSKSSQAPIVVSYFPVNSQPSRL